MLNQREREIAEAVRRGCIAKARSAYEQAGISGLCAEGRWEVAVDALHEQSLEELIAAGEQAARP